MGEPETLDGESAAVDAESSWILAVFRFGSNARPGGRTRLCCLSFGWLGVAAVVVVITCSGVEVEGYQIFVRHSAFLTLSQLDIDHDHVGNVLSLSSSTDNRPGPR
jgi:hypothetical protein